ncbi:hypothetical protein AALO_G00003730 [Alosa alosa]|uniref:Uncharacterized protein n=1 Tax=Alosa alosa TaxID=278164 RepID=A0AAV6HDV4_9TELE|nr:hypothetical protein AALO_G00003730 [Alosa alosa]
MRSWVGFSVCGTVPALDVGMIVAQERGEWKGDTLSMSGMLPHGTRNTLNPRAPSGILRLPPTSTGVKLLSLSQSETDRGKKAQQDHSQRQAYANRKGEEAMPNLRYLRL